MSTTVEVHELPARLGEVLSLAAAGTEVIVTEGHVSRARLVPLAPGHASIPACTPVPCRPAKTLTPPSLNITGFVLTLGDS